MTQDPVCGMDVQPEQAAGQSQHEGRTYYFCCEACKEKFDNNPERFARPEQAKAGQGR